MSSHPGTPRAKDPPSPDAESAPKTFVVVIDDSAEVLESTSRFLALKGFEVVTSSRGFGMTGTVLGRTPDVLVLDVMMPGIDGPALARIVRKQNPNARIVFYSAVTDHRAQNLLRDHPGALFVPKGRGVGALLDAITKSLARTGT
jgi:two-component system, cell cycle sensor histidine kinase and response regulator CckA